MCVFNPRESQKCFGKGTQFDLHFRKTVGAALLKTGPEQEAGEVQLGHSE